VFQIDLKSGVALYLQLKEQILKLVFMGGLSPDEQLPSVRNMARELGINPNTVAKAYSQLEADGAIYSLPGKGSFISGNILTNHSVRQDALAAFQKAAENAFQLSIEKAELEKILEQIYLSSGLGRNE